MCVTPGASTTPMHSSCVGAQVIEKANTAAEQ
jgi:hypothetical protein